MSALPISARGRPIAPHSKSFSRLNLDRLLEMYGACILTGAGSFVPISSVLADAASLSSIFVVIFSFSSSCSFVIVSMR
jgi:hypothetical protein